MTVFVLASFFSAFILAILDNMFPLRWWKAPIAILASSLAVFLWGEVSVKHQIVLVCASSFGSLILYLIAERLTVTTLPNFNPRR